MFLSSAFTSLTRLRKLDLGAYDAIVLAAAGLKRLGLADRIRLTFAPQHMLPAAGQGALAIEVASGVDATLRARIAQLGHLPTWLAAHAERAVSRELGGSCSMPLAAHAVWHGEVLRLDAAVGDPGDLSRPLLSAGASDPAADTGAASRLGARVAGMLREQGAASYLA